MSSKASTNYDTITGLETAGLAFAGRWIHGARLVHLRGLRGVPLGEERRREVRFSDAIVERKPPGVAILDRVPPRP